MANGSSNFVLRADSGQYVGEVSKAEKSTRGLDKSQKDLSKTADKSTSSMDKLTAKISQGREKFNAFAKVAVVAGLALTAAIVKNGLSSVDTLAKVSDKLGITTDKLAGLRHAAELTGVSSATMDTALEKLNVRMAEAATGTGLAVKSFDALGISSKELVKLSPDKAMGVIADKLSKVENSAQKAKIAYDIFGRSGVGLINTLQGGSAGLEAFQKEAEAAGVALNRIDARKVELANDAMFKVRQQFTGFSQHLAVKFAPVLEDIANRMFGVGKEAGGMATVAGKAFDYLVKAAGVFANGIHALNIGWNLMKLAFQEAAKFVVGGLDSLARAAVDMYNALPWVDEVQYTSMFDGFLSTMESEIAESRRKVDDLLSTPLPSDAIEDYVYNTERAFEAEAIAVQNSQENVQGVLLTTEQVTEKLAGTTEKFATVTEQTAVRVESAWDKALQGMVERIDTSFSTAWKDALDGNLTDFKDFSSSIFDAAKQLFAELLHLNITRPIVQGVAGMFGLGTGAAASAGGSAVTGGGGLGGVVSAGRSLISGGVGGALGSLGGVYNSVGNFFGAGSSIGNAALAQGRLYQYGSVGQGLGNLALGAGAGILGGFAGNAVFGGGGYSNVGATVGGIAGSVFGPIGAGVGSFIGSGIGSLFGGKNNGDNKGRANLDLGSGSLDVFGVGKSFEQANVDSAGSLAATLQRFSDSIGGSTAALNIAVGNKSGVSLNGEKFGEDVDAFYNAAFEQIIDGATNLDEKLRALALGFEGTAEETALFLQSITAVGALADFNPVTQAIEDFTATQPTLLEAYQSQSTALDGLIANYNGSAESTAVLNQALIVNKSAAYELATAIQAIGKSIADVAEKQAKSIRESILTGEQLDRARRSELKALESAFDSIIDPQELAQASQRRLELNRLIFDALPEEMQRTQAEAFAQQAEQIGTSTSAALDAMVATLQDTEAQRNAQINTLMETNARAHMDAAQVQQNAARENQETVGEFAHWVNKLIESGINVQNAGRFASIPSGEVI